MKKLFLFLAERVRALFLAKNPFERPAVLQSFGNSGIGYSSFLRPSTYGHGDTVECYKFGTTPGSIGNWLCKNPINRPTLFKSGQYNSWFNTKFICPLSGGQSLTIKGKNYILPVIVVLFNQGGPFAIFWTISKIVFNSVNRMIRTWRMPHILQKFRKGISPSFANGNSASPVVFVSSVFRIIATLLHIRPALPQEIHIGGFHV